MIVNGFPRGEKIYTDQVLAIYAVQVANSPGSLTVSWINPTSKKFVGTMIRYKEGSYPTSPTDGTLAYMGKGDYTTIKGLTGCTTYYVRAFAKASNASGTKIYYNESTAGAQVPGVTASAPVTNLSVNPVANDPSKMTINWTAPVGGCVAINVARKIGAYPTHATDGTVIYSGTGDGPITDTGLTGGTNYYYRAFTANGYAWNNDTSQQMSNMTSPTAVTLSLVSRTLNSLTIAFSAVPDPAQGIYILCKAGGYPANIDDGTRIYALWDVDGGVATASGLSQGTIYYFRAFVHNQNGVWNNSTSMQLALSTKIPAGQVVFTSSQLWVVPAGVYKAESFLVGAGGGGGASSSSTSVGGGGGYTKTQALSLAPGQQHAITIGAGGAGRSTYGVGGVGGATIFGSNLAVAEGGKGGGDKSSNNGCGGSGGGASSRSGGDGGSDGSAGYDNALTCYNYMLINFPQSAPEYQPKLVSGQPYAQGQGYTTRAFGNPAAAIYAGGGGGGYQGDASTLWQSAGGAGGGGRGTGGNGIYYKHPGSAGVPNTGGGGGSGTGDYIEAYSGGSGLMIIRWAEQ